MGVIITEDQEDKMEQENLDDVLDAEIDPFNDWDYHHVMYFQMRFLAIHNYAQAVEKLLVEHAEKASQKSPILKRGMSELPIRSIDFYYPEFQAANVRIFRDKSKICFLEPTWSNLCSTY